MAEYPKSCVLASIVIALRHSDGSFPISGWLGNEIRSMFYNMLSEADPSLCQKIHDEFEPKPFTASSLIRVRSQQYLIRFTILMSQLYKIWVQVLLDKFRDGHSISLKSCIFDIEKLIMGGTSERLADVTDYYSLWQDTSRREFHLRFISPTSFKAGRGNLPFPLPYSIYQGLLRKWNQFAPADLKMDEDILQIVANQVFPSCHSIHTTLVEQRNAKLIGFVGNCTFEILGDLSEEKLHQLTVLTGYAYYAGVGMKTTQGMGQTLVL
ncbi:MAG: CRISPR-associated endoribonuclease Cas6 [bacterium]